MISHNGKPWRWAMMMSCYDKSVCRTVIMMIVCGCRWRLLRIHQEGRCAQVNERIPGSTLQDVQPVRWGRPVQSDCAWPRCSATETGGDKNKCCKWQIYLNLYSCIMKFVDSFNCDHNQCLQQLLLMIILTTSWLSNLIISTDSPKLVDFCCTLQIACNNNNNNNNIISWIFEWDL